MPHLPASSALSRYTILDLTRVRAGPTCARQLADWGANVIKIEMPEILEGNSALGGPRRGPDFQNLHRNKRSITLNLKDLDGVSILKKMIKSTDVIVENYRPDVKDRLGINYMDLSKINPGLIYASISGFGQDGPYRQRRGFDQIAQGMGGLMSITGLEGQGPVRAGIPIADLCAGLLASQGIMIALLEREISGKGQWVQSSLLQSQVFMLDFQAARWTVDREVAPQAGNNHPTSIPTGVFETRDGHINIASAGQAIYERFCKAVDAEHLITNPDYVDGDARSKNRDGLNSEINEIMKTKDSQTWVKFLNDAGVPCGPINRIDQVFEDPQIKHSGASATVYSPDRGEEIELVAQAIKLSRTPSKLEVGPPRRGEHTEEILKEFGYTDEQIADFKDRVVV